MGELKSSYNRLGKFVLILLTSFFIVGFPFSLACEGEVSSSKEQPETLSEKEAEALTEDSPIDIIGESGGRGDKSSPLLDEFKLRDGSEAVSFTSHFFRLILSLVFVVFLAYIVIKFMKKSKLFVVNDDAYLKLVAQLNIEQGKSIKVFTLGEKAYIVGVTGNNITKIAEIEDKVLIDTMNLRASETPKNEAPSFSKVFSSFFPTTGKVKEAKKEVFDDEFLKNQQTRIKNMNLKNE